MLSDSLALADLARIAEDPTSEAALAALAADPPYPITDVLLLHREPLSQDRAAGSSLSEMCRVFYRVLDEDGAERDRMSPLGSFVMTALLALVREAGWSSEVVPLAARVRELIAAERAASGGDGETLGEWAVSADLGAEALVPVSALRREPVVAL